MDLASREHLWRHPNGRYYYNRAYPKELWPVTGKQPFRASLRTETLEQANRRRPEAEQRYWDAIDRARAAITAPVASSASSTREMSDDAIPALFSEWYQEAVEHIDAFLPKGGNEEAHEIAFLSATDELVEARRQLGTGDDWFARSAAKEAASAHSYRTSGTGFEQLVRLIARGRVELSALQLARLRGDFTYEPNDRAVVDSLSADVLPVSHQRTLGDLIAAYLADKEEGFAQSTRDAYGSILEMLKEHFGREKPVVEIDRDAARSLFELVKGVPTNRSKRPTTRGLSLQDAVKVAKRLDLPTISPKTINGSYMAVPTTLFNWAEDEGWIDKNPFRSLHVKDTIDARDKRDPFSLPQLRQLFRLKPWSPRVERDHPIRFWAPLMALHQGMRLAEIAQLGLDDVEKIGGVVVLQVRAGDGKRTKTAAGRRTLPVHRELIRMGFLQYVKQRRADGGTRLFAGEAPDTRGKWGVSVSRWFSRLLSKEGITGTRLSMHSLRHNFQDALREAGLHLGALGQELAGRANSNTSNFYGSGFSVTALNDAMDKVAYPELDLSHLYTADD